MNIFFLFAGLMNYMMCILQHSDSHETVLQVKSGNEVGVTIGDSLAEPAYADGCNACVNYSLHKNSLIRYSCHGIAIFIVM